MRIKVIDIYKDKYKAAYLVEHKNTDKRKRVYLIGYDGSRKGIAYAQYVWEEANGRNIPDGFQIDHINEDKTDDRLENLQLLSPAENSRKYVRHAINIGKIVKYVDVVCPVCGKTFQFERRNLSTHPNPCCSRKCGYKKGEWTKHANGISTPYEYKHEYKHKCKYCGGDIKNYTTGKKYCSKECRLKSKKKNM